jgi:integrase
MSVYKRKSGRWTVLIDLGGVAFRIAVELPQTSGGKRRTRTLGTFQTRGAAEAARARAIAAGESREIRIQEDARRRVPLGTFATKKDAERAERDALSARDRGLDITAGNLTVDEMIRRFLVDRASRCTPVTIRAYRELCDRYISRHLGSMIVAKVRPAHIAEWKATLLTKGGHKGGPLKSAATHAFALANTIWEWAIKIELAQVNPLRAVDAPRIARTEAKALSVDEIATLLAAADPTREGPFVRMALATGARRGELCGLEWRDVDLETRAVRIERSVTEPRDGSELKGTKTGKSRTVGLSTMAVEALKTQRFQQSEDQLKAGDVYEMDERRPVFTDPLGRRVTPVSMTRAFEKIARVAGLRTKLHALRHTAATLLIGGGTDVRSVAAILGHADATTTLRVYAHALPEAQTAAIDRLGVVLDGTASRDPE